MSKYNALRDHLAHRSGAVTMTLDEIATIVPGGLPPSAYQYEVWVGQRRPEPQAMPVVGSAGYDARPELGSRRVRFDPK